MAHSQTFPLIRRLRGGRFAAIHSSLAIGSAFVAGLAMYGLAANGTCLAALEESRSLVRRGASAVPDRDDERSNADSFLATRLPSRVAPDRMLRCQH